jgi:hypothetical protein
MHGAHADGRLPHCTDSCTSRHESLLGFGERLLIWEIREARRRATGGWKERGRDPLPPAGTAGRTGCRLLLAEVSGTFPDSLSPPMNCSGPRGCRRVHRVRSVQTTRTRRTARTK